MSKELFPPSTGSATGNPRNKTALKPGYSLMGWIRLTGSGEDLTGLRGRTVNVSKQELAKHNTNEDCWMAIRGKVYNVTRYLEFHPGGAEQLMRGDFAFHSLNSRIFHRLPLHTSAQVLAKMRHRFLMNIMPGWILNHCWKNVSLDLWETQPQWIYHPMNFSWGHRANLCSRHCRPPGLVRSSPTVRQSMRTRQTKIYQL